MGGDQWEDLLQLRTGWQGRTNHTVGSPPRPTILAMMTAREDLLKNDLPTEEDLEKEKLLKEDLPKEDLLQLRTGESPS